MEPFGDQTKAAAENEALSKEQEPTLKELTVPLAGSKSVARDSFDIEFKSIPVVNLKPNSKKSADQLLKVVSNPNINENTWLNAWHELSERQKIDDESAQAKGTTKSKLIICLAFVIAGMLITIACIVLINLLVR